MILPLFTRGGSFHFLPENMGGPCIILKKNEGGSHKTSLRKHEFSGPPPPPVLYDQSFSYLLIYYLLFNVIKWLLWNAQLGIFLCLFNLKILCQWNLSGNFVSSNFSSSLQVYLTSLKFFFYANRVCKQFISSFQALQTIFFNIFHTPPPEK